MAAPITTTTARKYNPTTTKYQPIHAPPTSAIRETSSTLDETEENGFDQQNLDVEENNFVLNSYSLLEQAIKQSDNSF